MSWPKSATFNLKLRAKRDGLIESSNVSTASSGGSISPLREITSGTTASLSLVRDMF